MVMRLVKDDEMAEKMHTQVEDDVPPTEDDDGPVQELADDFGVAKTTMHHHLITLRSVGLVRMRLSDKRYSLRQDVVDHLGELLSAYLKGPT